MSNQRAQRSGERSPSPPPMIPLPFHVMPAFATFRPSRPQGSHGITLGSGGDENAGVGEEQWNTDEHSPNTWGWDNGSSEEEEEEEEEDDEEDDEEEDDSSEEYSSSDDDSTPRKPSKPVLVELSRLYPESRKWKVCIHSRIGVEFQAMLVPKAGTREPRSAPVCHLLCLPHGNVTGGCTGTWSETALHRPIARSPSNWAYYHHLGGAHFKNFRVRRSVKEELASYFELRTIESLIEFAQQKEAREQELANAQGGLPSQSGAATSSASTAPPVVQVKKERVRNDESEDDAPEDVDKQLTGEVYEGPLDLDIAVELLVSCDDSAKDWCICIVSGNRELQCKPLDYLTVLCEPHMPLSGGCCGNHRPPSKVNDDDGGRANVAEVIKKKRCALTLEQFLTFHGFPCGDDSVKYLDELRVRRFPAETRTAFLNLHTLREVIENRAPFESLVEMDYVDPVQGYFPFLFTPPNSAGISDHVLSLRSLSGSVRRTRCYIPKTATPSKPRPKVVDQKPSLRNHCSPQSSKSKKKKKKKQKKKAYPNPSEDYWSPPSPPSPGGFSPPSSSPTRASLPGYLPSYRPSPMGVPPSHRAGRTLSSVVNACPDARHWQFCSMRLGREYQCELVPRNRNGLCIWRVRCREVRRRCKKHKVCGTPILLEEFIVRHSEADTVADYFASVRCRCSEAHKDAPFEDLPSLDSLMGGAPPSLTPRPHTRSSPIVRGVTSAVSEIRSYMAKHLYMLQVLPVPQWQARMEGRVACSLQDMISEKQNDVVLRFVIQLRDDSPAFMRKVQPSAEERAKCEDLASAMETPLEYVEYLQGQDIDLWLDKAREQSTQPLLPSESFFVAAAEPILIYLRDICAQGDDDDDAGQ
eukprot:TRINITY_DN1551_c0_g1_i1.p1 TRINITY_DN1551_c0_g1~~TRINITY_DN1551_c0_g1_i1.p1  ORF type:complete len:866 (-),score=158.93 TRINITY_DN1551_c0_g1_i1:65-2662(-)